MVLFCLSLPAGILFGVLDFHVALSGGVPEEEFFAFRNLTLLTHSRVVLNQMLKETFTLGH